MTLKSRITLWIAKRAVGKQVAAWLASSLARPLTWKEKKMLNALIGNWKTTLFGLLGAIVQAAAGGMSWKAIVSSLPTLLLGIMAKDSTTGSQIHP